MRVFILFLLWFNHSVFAGSEDVFFKKIQPGHSISTKSNSPELSLSNWFSLGKKLRFSEIDKNEAYCLVQIKTSNGKSFSENAVVKEGAELVIEEINNTGYEQYLEIKTRSLRGNKVLFYCLGKKGVLSNGRESRLAFLKDDFLQIFDGIFNLNDSSPIEI